LPEAATPDAIDAFVENHPQGMFYHSRRWIDLVTHLTGSSYTDICVMDAAGELSAWCPLFFHDGPAGIVANSSPFFGSHGGILAVDDTAFTRAADAVMEELSNRNAQSLNIIEPLECPRSRLYSKHLPVGIGDHRIAHTKSLEGMADRDSLFGSLGGLVRSNLKRKAWRANLAISRAETSQAMANLQELHIAEMGARPDGNPKKPEFFEAVQTRLLPGTDWRLYEAHKDGVLAASLLLFTWGRYVEYITPVTAPDFRRDQPLTALLFEAMLDCASDGYSIWNWGGSWPSQEGVQNFKDSWGGEHGSYRYHVVDNGGLDRLQEWPDRAELLAAYGGYYLFPFTPADQDGQDDRDGN
jgi:hypothetical protein